MTEMEREIELAKVLARVRRVFGNWDHRTSLYAQYLWIKQGEPAARNWINRHIRGGPQSAEELGDNPPVTFTERAIHYTAQREMDSFYEQGH